jgi:hypothetical protein
MAGGRRVIREKPTATIVEEYDAVYWITYRYIELTYAICRFPGFRLAGACALLATSSAGSKATLCGGVVFRLLLATHVDRFLLWAFLPRLNPYLFADEEQII